MTMRTLGGMDRHGLGAFLRAKRERVRPSDVGLPQGVRRRTPGLRREEVAQLAQISTEHYSRLEQGTGRHPSPGVLGGIAQALRLSRQERDHLFRLAGHADTGQPAGPSDHVPPSTLTLLDRLGDAGVIVLSASCQVLAWNPLAAALFEDFSALGTADRNIVRRYFLQPPSGHPRYGIGSARRFVGIAVSYLRLAATRYPQNRDLRTLISDLIAGSPEFAERWHAQEMRIEHHSEEVLDHPAVGRLTLDFEILSVPGEDQQVVIFTAERDSSEYRALQLLNVIGTQDMTPEAPGHRGR